MPKLFRHNTNREILKQQLVTYTYKYQRQFKFYQIAEERIPWN